MRSPRYLVLLTAALAVGYAGLRWTAGDLRSAHDILLVLASTVPLLAIRRNPVVVAVVLAAVYPFWLSPPLEIPDLRTGTLLQSLPLLAAGYASGTWNRPVWTRSLANAAPAWIVIAIEADLWSANFTETAFVVVLFPVVWALGLAMGDRQRYAERLEASTAGLLAAERELAERAVADERARIARELHDVIAHAMSVITVQAGVGAHVVGSRPQQAAESLGIIERTGREAMSELRRVLVVLRDPAGDRTAGPAPEPQPGLADLPSLIETAGDAGVTATLEIRGAVGTVPPGLDLAAYRVVQEALTNVAKHADGARTSVCVTYRPGRLVVEVENAGAFDPEYTPGHGLRGMAERVSLYDGELSVAAGPTGFRVRASFPLEPPLHETVRQVG